MGVKEKALTAASSIASGDFLRMVTSAGAARKIDYSKLAKAIVEEYNGSTIAGSAQTLKAALDSLNSKIVAEIASPSNGSMSALVEAIIAKITKDNSLYIFCYSFPTHADGYTALAWRTNYPNGEKRYAGIIICHDGNVCAFSIADDGVPVIISLS